MISVTPTTAGTLIITAISATTEDMASTTKASPIADITGSLHVCGDLMLLLENPAKIVEINFEDFAKSACSSGRKTELELLPIISPLRIWWRGQEIMLSFYQ